MVTCRWCGASLNDATQLSEHEAIHKLLDGLGGYLTHEPIIQLNNDSQVTNERDLTPKNTFQCDQCTKSFRYKQSLNQHVIAAHTNQTFDCSKCGKVFKYDKHRLLHEKSCQGSGEHVCCQCGKRCFTSQGLKKHTVWHEKKGKENSSSSNATTTDRASIRLSNKRSQFCCRQCTECFDSKKDLIEHNMSHHSQTGSSRQSNATLQQYHCRRCTECFNNRRDLYLHGIRQHYQTGGALQQRPWDDDSAPWNRNDQQDRLRQVYEANEPLILEPHRLGPIHSVYNFQLDNDVNVNQLMRYADNIFNREQRAFRLNLVFGVILQNRETGEYRYFVPYNNNGIFERPLYVSRRGDLGQLRLRLQQRDILDEMLRHRQDTKWIPVLVINVHFTVYSTLYPLGTGEVPEFLMRKESIYPLIKSQLTGKRYKDHLCVFRCLALHRGHDIRNVDGPAKEFHRKWQTNANTCQDGITFDDFPAFEKFFNVNLEVYSLQEDGFARSIYKSRGLQETTMYLNMYENHLSYIRDFAMYAQKYQCKTCDRHFDRINNLHRHQKICTNKTKYVYPGGFYQSRESVFEELDRYGIHVPEDQRLFPWFACFDFEAMLQKVNDQPTEFLTWSQCHVPVSVSICSNIQGYTKPVCIVNPDENELVLKMVKLLTDISITAYDLAKEKWGWVLDEIDAKIAKDEEFQQDFDNRADQENAEEEEEEKPFHPLKKLYGYMEGYMSQIPVIGFNSAKYDLNLIKRNIARHLDMHSTMPTLALPQTNSNFWTCLSF